MSKIMNANLRARLSAATILSGAALSMLISGCQNESTPGAAAQTAPASQAAPTSQDATPNTNHITRPPEEDVVYFMLPDRFENGDPSNDTGGFPGGKYEHGFDPTHKGFYNGGDLKGLTSRLDYIKGMGATAIWLGPIEELVPPPGLQGR